MVVVRFTVGVRSLGLGLGLGFRISCIITTDAGPSRASSSPVKIIQDMSRFQDMFQDLKGISSLTLTSTGDVFLSAKISLSELKSELGG